MHDEGVPLMRRIVPADAAMRQWDHYPAQDILSPATGARAFYHAHPPGECVGGEHGHFHLSLARAVMPDPAAPLIAPPDRAPAPGDTVHVVALSIDPAGLPCGMFTVNRWVTDEWLFAAADVLAALDRFDLTRAAGDPLVNAWLTAMVRLCRPLIGPLLIVRDHRLRAIGLAGEDRSVERLSHVALDLPALLASASNRPAVTREPVTTEPTS